MNTWPLRTSPGRSVWVGHRRFAGAVLLVALSVAGCVKLDAGNHDSGVKSLLQVGSRLPDSLLTQSNGKMVRLNDPTGRVKLISIVPTLNTVISESQTRHISEALPALNGVIERVTVSAIGAEEQERFAKQATIQNMVFLSDAPHFAFGTATGLWLPKEQRLQRAVIVANRENVVQYFELVPTAQFPNYDRLYQVVRRTVAQP